MQILGPHLGPTNSEILMEGPVICFSKPSRWCWCVFKFGQHFLKRIEIPLKSKPVHHYCPPITLPAQYLPTPRDKEGGNEIWVWKQGYPFILG